MSSRPDGRADDDAARAPADELGGLVDVLAAADIWVDPPVHLEDAVVEAIRRRQGRAGPAVRQSSRPPIPAAALRSRPLAVGAALGVAAAGLVFVVALSLDLVRVGVTASGGSEAVHLQLAASGGTPEDVAADAQLRDLPGGMRIELQLDGLPPAPAGSRYEVHVQAPAGPTVGAGSFHLRGGGGRVVLWAGLEVQPGLVVEVTREPDGVLVLSGQVGAAD